ncbi:MAG: hypothetical protein ACOYXA_09445 [Bacteroidota bacterium]
MEDKRFDQILEGFFYFFGFSENPAEKKAKAILRKSAAESIKNDLKKVNKDYRAKLEELRKEALCLE